MQDESRSITNDQRHIRKNPQLLTSSNGESWISHKNAPRENIFLQTTRPSQKYIWNKYKLTRTPPEINFQSSTRTIYDKEDTGFI